MSTKTKRPDAAPRHPERKYGPFHGGVGVAVWLNHVQTEQGTRYFRSVTLSSRRFRDPKTGEWKDAGSLRSTDLPALILALEAARDYMTSTPLPGEAIDEEQAENEPPSENGSVPF